MVVEVIKYKVEFTQVQHGYYKCEPSWSYTELSVIKLCQTVFLIQQLLVTAHYRFYYYTATLESPSNEGLASLWNPSMKPY